MHHGNPDKQCEEVDILYAWTSLPQIQMPYYVPLRSGGCPGQRVQESIG